MARMSGLNQMFFGNFIDLATKYTIIKSEPDSRKDSTLLGKTSIKYTIAYLVLLVCALVSAYFAMSLMDNDKVLYSILLCILAVALAISGLLYMLLAVVSAVYQLRVNRKTIGWVALGVSLGLVVCLVVVVLILAN